VIVDGVDKYQYYYRGEEVPEAIERIFDAYDHFKEDDVGTLENPVVAGGACRAWAFGENPRDIDVYLTSNEDRQKIVSDDEHAAVYKLKTVLFGQQTTEVDVINFVYSDMEAILNTFDMTVAMCAVDTNQLVCHTNYLADLASKSIVFTNLGKPMNSLLRLQKYIKYGFTAHPRELTLLAQSFYMMSEEPKMPDFARDPVTGHFVLDYQKGTVPTQIIPF